MTDGGRNMSDKPSLLYASPFPPQKSGISDYSEVLVNELAKKFDITLYSDDYEIESPSLKKYPVLKNGVDTVEFDCFDHIIYNIGNNPWFHGYIYEAAIKHPGMVILHDFVLYYLFVGSHLEKGDLYSEIYDKLGMDCFLEIKDRVKELGPELLEHKQLASLFPMNRELISSGNKIMVHSEYSRNRVLENGWIDGSKVRHINIIKQVEEDNRLIPREKLFKKYGIPGDALIISSFGYIAETKLNKEVAQAVKELSAETGKKLCYVMAGEGDYANSELTEGLIIKTGYTELDEFNSLIQYSDIVANLRFPTMGETSAAMLRILQLGKPCITNNGGWFSELPDTCVLKVDLGDRKENIKNALRTLITDVGKRTELIKNATEYIEREYSSDKITDEIARFLRE